MMDQSTTNRSLKGSNDQITVQVNLNIHPKIYEFFKGLLEFLDVGLDQWISSEILTSIKSMEFGGYNYITYYIDARFREVLEESGLRK